MRPWKRLEPKDFPLIYSFIKSAVARGHYSYNLTLVESITSYGRQLYYTVEDDVLLVARNGNIFNNFFHKLVFQPIHATGDKDKEIETLKKLIEKGVSARIPQPLAKEAGLDYSYEPALSGGKEVLYTRQDFNLSGKKYANVRNVYSRFRDNLSKGKLTLKRDLPFEALVPLYEKWLKEREYVKGAIPTLLAHQVFREYIKSVSLVNESGEVVFTSLYFDYGCGVWGIIASMADFSTPYTSSLQSTSIIYFFDLHPELEVVFWGGWDAKGVEFMKKKLPHTILSQVRPKPVRRLTKEECEAFKPQPSNFFGV